jgi:hypothetical protein
MIQINVKEYKERKVKEDLAMILVLMHLVQQVEVADHLVVEQIDLVHLVNLEIQVLVVYLEHQVHLEQVDL